MMARIQVAVVGAGPSGSYCAAALMRADERIDVDVFDQLPSPWGLLRTGVAPDHDEIRRLRIRLESQTYKQRCKFIGNTRLGTDLSHDDLAQRYHAIFYATGAQNEPDLGIPGEDLSGSWPAGQFVGWYNGHPDFRHLRFDLSSERAVVIGNGNVAADVARVLLTPPDRLESTEISIDALEALRVSRVREVMIIGRKGPAHAAFTSSVLNELATLADIELNVRADDLFLDEPTQRWLANHGTFTARKNLEILSAASRRVSQSETGRRITLAFFRAPTAISGHGRVESVRLAKTAVTLQDDCSFRTEHLANEYEVINCGLVLRAIGYRGVPIPGVPFDPNTGRIPNVRGRVITISGEVLTGVYTTGWIKRGASGFLGTNRRDAEESVGSFIDDLKAGQLAN